MKQGDENITEELAILADATRRLCTLHGSLSLDYPSTDAFATPSGIPRPSHAVPSPSAQKRAARQSSAAPVQTKKPAFSAQDILTLRDTISNCEHCLPEQKRPQPLFGKGREQRPSLLLVGDAIDAEGATEGQVFPGQSGELLIKMLAAINLDENEVFQANIIRCVIDNKELPLSTQLKNCRPHLLEQIKLLQPLVICTMGQIASQALLGTNNKLIALRGRFHQLDGIPLMPTYHPSQLLQVPDLKKAAWYDLQLIENKIKQLRS